ncbi:hypothetical protein N9D66_00705 [Candidatus Nanopelagicales bacterium]|nr:hypothetical protein [Candidatus Nanopelagicales bacterium]
MAPTTWHATLSAALTLITRNLVLLPAQPTAAELAVAMPTAVGAILVGELDWAVAQQFQRAGVAHLLLSPGARSAAASSWVTPGSSPCLRCQYLCVRDADPQWANVLAQLHNWPTPDPDPLLVHACGLYVANAVRTHLKQAAVMGDAPAQIGLLGAIPNANRSEFHPGCGCARGVATEKTRVAA